MNRVFTDDNLQEQFEKDGFVIIDLFNAAELMQLNEFSYSIIDDPKGFYTSHHMPDEAKRKLIDVTLKKYFDNKFNATLSGYRSIFHNLLVKNPGADSTLAMHQDWCFTDEKQYAGLNVWAPLIDSTKSNGCLQVIKGSHKFALPVYRGRGFNVLEKIKHESFEGYVTDVEVPAGKCVIMHLALMHSSLPNLTDKTRIAVSAIMVPQHAQVMQYSRSSENDNFIYEVGINENELASFMPTQTLNLTDARKLPFDSMEIGMEKFRQIAAPKRKGMFVNDNLNNLLNTQGYVVLSLLNRQEVKDITDLYKDVPSGVDGLFYTSIWSKDEQYRKNVNAFLKKLVVEKFENIFTDFKPIFGNLIIKKPGASSAIELHQDWTLVNESEYNAVNIWCPLNDTNADNGCLQVIPGSHKFFNVLRGRLMYNPLQNISHLLKQRYLKQLVLNAGDCVVFDTRLLHASADNVSGKERIAFSVTATHKQAQLYHYVGNNRTAGVMHELAIDETFFENYSIEKADFKQGDQGVTAVREHRFSIEDVTIEAFEKKMKTNLY